MRRHVLSVVAAASVVAGALWMAPTAAAQTEATVEKAVVMFNEPVRVAGRFLMGWYVIEHDEGRAARGEPCTHIYEGDDTEEAGNLVVAFYCLHRDRKPAANTTLTVTSNPTINGIAQLDEFQFAGSADGHGVPR